MLLFSKLVDETQMSKPPEATRHHNSRKLLIPLLRKVVLEEWLAVVTQPIATFLTLYPLEPFRITHFNMRHPVAIEIIMKAKNFSYS
jgi:hypothetical protein